MHINNASDRHFIPTSYAYDECFVTVLTNEYVWYGICSIHQYFMQIVKFHGRKTGIMQIIWSLTNNFENVSAGYLTLCIQDPYKPQLSGGFFVFVGILSQNITKYPTFHIHIISYIS